MSPQESTEQAEAERWLTDFLTANAATPPPATDELLEANYFEQELLDSLGIVQLIVGIEDRFEVRLDAEHMQDPRFCTIRGLAQIVEELRA